MSEAEIPNVWPEENLEVLMIEQAEWIAHTFCSAAALDMVCHVKALLSRVRDLERECDRLRVYERGIFSMSSLINPEWSAEMVADILGELKALARATR